jgi:transposase
MRWFGPLSNGDRCTAKVMMAIMPAHPKIKDGVMRLSAAQLSALLEGLDWRRVHEARETTTPKRRPSTSMI